MTFNYIKKMKTIIYSRLHLKNRVSSAFVKKTFFMIILLSFIYYPTKGFIETFITAVFSNELTSFELSKEMLINANPFFKLGVDMHIFSSVLLFIFGFLIIGLSAFNKFGKLHRSLGYAYFTLQFGFAIPGAILLTPYSFGTRISVLMFLILAALWLITGVLALRSILKKDISAHKGWVLLNFSISLSAPLQRWLVHAVHSIKIYLIENPGIIVEYDAITLVSFGLPVAFCLLFIFLKKGYTIKL